MSTGVMSFTNVTRSTNQAQYYAPYAASNATIPRPPQGQANVKDDYERWYTEQIPNNRMALALQSGVEQEVSWALDRVLQLCLTETFIFSIIPGILDGLFLPAEWYSLEGYKKFNTSNTLFAIPRELEKKRLHAIQAMFALRNCALNAHDCSELVRHSHTMPLIIHALQNVTSNGDENTEFLLHCTEFMHIIASHYHPTALNWLGTRITKPLEVMAAASPNRPSIISALRALTLLMNSPTNVALLRADSLAVTASIRYLPLFMDIPLVDACINYLYVHLSQQNMARAFMHHPDMPSVLRVLVSLLLSEQEEVERATDIGVPTRAIPTQILGTATVHSLSQSELDWLLPMAEPTRCFEWMKLVFVYEPDAEVTQVDFWKLYQDVFQPFAAQHALLPASEVIKNVTLVFPEARAMVLDGPPAKFIVKGVARRMDTTSMERLKCRWERDQCPALVFSTPNGLAEHVKGHVLQLEATQAPCLWGSCTREALPKSALRAHVLTHLASKKPPDLPSSQSDTITVVAEAPDTQLLTPMQRILPPAPVTKLRFPEAAKDPPSTSLAALLVIRILFRTAFTSTEEAPRVDDDHFGFPGIVDEQEDSETPKATGDERTKEREGCRRGKKAFAGVRHLLQRVSIRDEPLMGWITEMLDASLTGDLYE